MVVVVHITGSSSRPDMSSLLAGMYTMKVRYTRDTELSTAQAMHRHSEQHTTFSGPEMRGDNEKCGPRRIRIYGPCII